VHFILLTEQRESGVSMASVCATWQRAVKRCFQNDPR
jgi:hypothetical protein